MREIELKNDELEETVRRAASSLENVQSEIYARIEENEFLKTDLEEKLSAERQLREEVKGEALHPFLTHPDLQAALEVNHSHLEKLRSPSKPSASEVEASGFFLSRHHLTNRAVADRASAFG
jgi:hypothetical protein